jgi:hypothetical protein
MYMMIIFIATLGRPQPRRIAPHDDEHQSHLGGADEELKRTSGLGLHSYEIPSHTKYQMFAPLYTPNTSIWAHVHTYDTTIWAHSPT